MKLCWITDKDTGLSHISLLGSIRSGSRAKTRCGEKIFCDANEWTPLVDEDGKVISEGRDLFCRPCTESLTIEDLDAAKRLWASEFGDTADLTWPERRTGGAAVDCHEALIQQFSIPGLARLHELRFFLGTLWSFPDFPDDNAPAVSWKYDIMVHRGVQISRAIATAAKAESFTFSKQSLDNYPNVYGDPE